LSAVEFEGKFQQPQRALNVALSERFLALQILVIVFDDDSLVGIDTGFDLTGDRFFFIERLVDIIDRALVIDHRLRGIRQSWPQAVWIAGHGRPFTS